MCSAQPGSSLTNVLQLELTIYAVKERSKCGVLNGTHDTFV